MSRKSTCPECDSRLEPYQVAGIVGADNIIVPTTLQEEMKFAIVRKMYDKLTLNQLEILETWVDVVGQKPKIIRDNESSSHT